MKDNILKFISLFFFIIFIVNVLIGKINTSYDRDFFHFGDVTEFLLLLVSSTSLIIVALDLESRHKRQSGNDQNTPASNS